MGYHQKKNFSERNNKIDFSTRDNFFASILEIELIFSNIISLFLSQFSIILIAKSLSIFFF